MLPTISTAKYVRWLHLQSVWLPLVTVVQPELFQLPELAAQEKGRTSGEQHEHLLQVCGS